MSISVTCASCQRIIRAKDEYAGKRVRCPGCQSPVTIPAPEVSSIELLDLSEEFPLDPPPASVPTPKATSKKVHGKTSATGSPWYVQHWHWFVALAVLVLSVIPMAGFVIAGFVFLIGMGMAFFGGIVPIIRIVAGAPGTVLQLIVSRSARFEMMRQPDDHPYKVLVRNASKPTRGILWRGVLLMLVFLPALRLQGLGTELFRNWRANDTADVGMPPDPFRPGGMRPDGIPAEGPGMNRQPMVPSTGSPADGRPTPAIVPGQASSNLAAQSRTAGDSDQDSTGNSPAGQPPFGLRGQPPPFGGPGTQPPFGGPGRPSGDASMADRIFLISLSLDASNVTGDPFEVLKSAVGELPGYISDTLSMGDDVDRAEFQHRGEFHPRDLGRTMMANGLRLTRAQVKPVPGR
jgi:hypothetical protein